MLLLQARHHVGARRHHGTRGRLSRQIRARLRTQRCSRSGRRQWCSRFAGSRRRGRREYARTGCAGSVTDAGGSGAVGVARAAATAAAVPTRFVRGEARERGAPEQGRCATGDAAAPRHPPTTAVSRARACCAAVLQLRRNGSLLRGRGCGGWRGRFKFGYGGRTACV